MKNAKSHCAGLSPSLSLYLSATACIEGTCGAAISSGRFMDVETMPVLRWVQLKTDASPANSMCGTEILLQRAREGAAYDGNQCKLCYFRTNLLGSLLLQIRGEGYDPRPQGGESLLRSRDIRKQGRREGR